MKIAIAQIEPKLAQFQQNMQKHLSYIQLAIDAGAEMIIFPEMALTGYSLQDLSNTSAITIQSSKLDPLRQVSEKIDIITGFPEKDERSIPYISSVLISKGEVKYVHRKCYLPINGIFNDLKDFKPGKKIDVFTLRNGLKASILICRDIWHMDTILLSNELEASVIFAPSAVPIRSITEKGPGVSAFMERTIQGYAEKGNMFFLFANRVGFEEGLCFYGGSMVADPFGRIVVKGPFLEEQLIMAEIDWKELERKNKVLPLILEQQFFSSWNKEV